MGKDKVEDSGDVLVQEKKMGSYAIVETQDGARAVWTNAAVLFVVDAETPTATLAWYRAFPLYKEQ